MFGVLPLFVGGMPGGMGLAVVLLIAVLLFGADKLPKLARASGEAMGEFREGREELEKEIEESAKAVEERETEEATEGASA